MGSHAPSAPGSKWFALGGGVGAYVERDSLCMSAAAAQKHHVESLTARSSQQEVSGPGPPSTVITITPEPKPPPHGTVGPRNSVLPPTIIPAITRVSSNGALETIAS